MLPRFSTEHSCLKLVFTTLLRTAARWQRIARTPLELAQLQLLYAGAGLVPATSIGQVAYQVAHVRPSRMGRPTATE